MFGQGGESRLCCFMQEQVEQKISPFVMGLEQRTLHGWKVATSQTQLLPESPVALLEPKTREVVYQGRGSSLRPFFFNPDLKTLG